MSTQVRFRDIARGGLRVVAPRSKEQHAAESTRTYNEAYSLAFTQQLKNKDIPEGGAKSTILLEPDQSDEFIPELFGQSFMIRKVRAAPCEGAPPPPTPPTPLLLNHGPRLAFVHSTLARFVAFDVIRWCAPSRTACWTSPPTTRGWWTT